MPAVRTRKRRPTPVGSALKRLGAQIRELRIAASLTQAKLGDPYVTRAGVSRVELGQSAPSVTLLIHFARVLKKRVRELIPPDL